MNSSQVAYVLGELGYSADSWTDLSAVQVINMAQDTNFYTDPNKIRVRFNTTTESMEVVYGALSGITFTSESGETSDYTPTSFVDFKSILGFLRSVVAGPQGTYYKKFFGNENLVDYTKN
jgi:hypothetical protein